MQLLRIWNYGSWNTVPLEHSSKRVNIKAAKLIVHGRLQNKKSKNDYPNTLLQKGRSVWVVVCLVLPTRPADEPPRGPV
jgi:hypothetical protein